MVGWEGKSTQAAMLIQDHWQLYFKGNSQNCDTALHNCREPILFLDAMPKMIKGIVQKGPYLNKRMLWAKERCHFWVACPLHTCTKAVKRHTTEPSRYWRDMTIFLPHYKTKWETSDWICVMHTRQDSTVTHIYYTRTHTHTPADRSAWFQFSMFPFDVQGLNRGDWHTALHFYSHRKTPYSAIFITLMPQDWKLPKLIMPIK